MLCVPTSTQQSAGVSKEYPLVSTVCRDKVGVPADTLQSADVG